MKQSERNVRKQKTGKPTQKMQEDILNTLDELIDKYQDKESQGSGDGSGKPSGQQNKDGSGQGGQPRQNSGLGGGGNTSLGRSSQKGDRWGNMRDKDRQAIEQGLQNSLPSHYKKMLEAYYKKLGMQPPGESK